MTTGDIDFDGQFRLALGGEAEEEHEIPFPLATYILWIILIILMPVLLITLLVLVVLI